MKLFQKTIFATTVMLITIVSTLSAQPHTRNLADVVLDPEYNPPPGEQEITSSGLYRWGEGEGATLDKAKERARHDLATKIQAFIQSTQTRIYAEEGIIHQINL